MATQKSKWIVNKHGVAVSFPEALADKFVTTKPGFRFALAHEITETPEEKQYPDDLDLTEKGRKRRAMRREAAEAKKVQAERATVKKEEPVVVTGGPAQVDTSNKEESTELMDKAATGAVLSEEEFKALAWTDFLVYAKAQGVNTVKKSRAVIEGELLTSLGQA